MVECSIIFFFFCLHTHAHTHAHNQTYQKENKRHIFWLHGKNPCSICVFHSFSLLKYWSMLKIGSDCNLFGHFCSISFDMHTYINRCYCYSLWKTETNRKMVHETKSNDLCVFFLFSLRSSLATTLKIPWMLARIFVSRNIVCQRLFISSQSVFRAETHSLNKPMRLFSGQFNGQLIEILSIIYVFVCTCQCLCLYQLYIMMLKSELFRWWWMLVVTCKASIFTNANRVWILERDALCWRTFSG